MRWWTVLAAGGAVFLAGAGATQAQSGITDKFGAQHVIGFTSPQNQPVLGALASEAGVRWTRSSRTITSVTPDGPRFFCAPA